MKITDNVKTFFKSNVQKKPENQETALVPKDSFQKSDMGYFENLADSTMNGAAHGFMKGMGAGIDFSLDLVPKGYGVVSIFSGLFIGVPAGLALGCVGGPIGLVAGFAMGLVGKNPGLPESLKPKQ